LLYFNVIIWFLQLLYLKPQLLSTEIANESHGTFITMQH